MAWVLLNNSFETPTVSSGSNSDFSTLNPGTDWTSSSGFSAIANHGTFDGATAQPDGNQCAFLYDVSGWISQAVSGIPAGTYTISMWAKQSPNNFGVIFNNIAVSVDGTPVSTISPPNATWAFFTTSQFTVASGSRTIRLDGTSAGGTNAVVCLDLVTVNLISLAGMLFRPPTLSLGGAGKSAQPDVNS